MRLWLAALLLPSLALGADTFTYDLSVRAEGELRVLTPQAIPQPPIGSLEVLPVAGLEGSFGADHTHLGLSYLPRFSLEGPGDSVTTQLLHRGQLFFDTRSRDGFRFFTTDQASYGTLDFATALLQQSLPTALSGPASAQVPQLDAIPVVQTLPFNEYVGQAGISFLIGKHANFTLQGSYIYSGGLTAESRVTLPLQKRPQASFQLNVEGGREDNWTTDGYANYATFDGSTDPSLTDDQEPWRAKAHPLLYQSVAIAQLTETWRHRLNRLADLSVGVGASAIRQVQNYFYAPVSEVVPVIILNGRGTVPVLGHDKVDLDLSALLEPYIDRYSGQGYERAELNAQGTYLLPPDWTVVGRVRGAVAVLGGPNHGTSVAAVEIVGGRFIRRDLKAEIGTRLTFQREPVFSPNGYFEWVSFVSLTLTERGRL